MKVTLDVKCEECGHKWSQETEETTVVLVCPNCKENGD